MRVDSIISELEKKFPGWKIGNKIGEGSGEKQLHIKLPEKISDLQRMTS